MEMDIQKLILEILERISRVETKIDDYNGLRDKIDKAFGMALQNTKDIQEIKDDNKWLWRTTVAAIIVAVTSLLMKGFGVK